MREPRQIHTCTVCGKEDFWSDDWQWFGSYRDLDDGKPIEKFCSERCLERHAAVVVEAR
jgi:hypothetical protein